MSAPQANRPGLTRPETIVVICLGGLGISLLVIALDRERHHHSWLGPTQTLNNLKMHALALHALHRVHKKLPPAFDRFGAWNLPASIHVHLLPFIEHENLHKKFVSENAVSGNFVPVFINADLPDCDLRGLQNNAANLRVFSERGLATPFDSPIFGLAAVEPGSAQLPKSFPDGTSNTILFATKHGLCGDGGSRYDAPPNSPFAAFFGQDPARVRAHPSASDVTFQLNPLPRQCRVSPLTAQSFGAVGIFVSLADGSARHLSSEVSPRTWNALLQPNDGIKLGDDW